MFLNLPSENVWLIYLFALEIKLKLMSTAFFADTTRGIHLCYHFTQKNRLMRKQLRNQPPSSRHYEILVHLYLVCTHICSKCKYD